MGAEIAPATRVLVTNQVPVEEPTPGNRGKSDRSGTTMVWTLATPRPHEVMTAIVAPGPHPERWCSADRPD
ncbi:hypothetical protein GCM10023175_50370 [Pseudonocardia xishanensis]|uniref:Uncharacterized protein n=1 Tax=Pseudonocardia xishanensis TaxID=630995 RepID=A0ABP8RXQ8_9PSEU